MFPLLATLLGLRSLPRDPDADDRSVTLALGARFLDELLSGLPIVLMPTIRSRLGLRLADVGLAYQLLDVAAAVAEPINGALIDVADRRWLLAWGAAACGVATLLIGSAQAWVLVVVGLAVYGLGSGPLAHTGDVVLIESHPEAVDRISTRSTVVDTVGALLAPVLVAVTGWYADAWRALLLGGGCVAAAYAALALSTRFPRPRWVSGGALAVLRANLGSIARSPEARLWIGLLVLEGVLDVPVLFQPLWLADVVGMGQGLVGAHVTVELVASLIGLVFLERVLVRRDGGDLLRASLVATAVLYPTWLLVPGVASRFVLAVPLTIVRAPVWPLLRGRALASVPGGAGTVSALTSLFGLVPVALVFGWFAGRVGLTTALLVGHLVPIAVMLALLARSTAARR
jgi:MFS family permease